MRIISISAVLVVSIGAIGFLVGRVMMDRREPTLRAQQPLGPNAAFLETRSGRVHYLDQGSGPVILLVHGTGRSIADWQEGFADLLSRTHRVIAFDYYGHGLSDRAHGWRYGHKLWTEQVVDVLDALHIDKVTVIGHSVGGVIASRLGADYPERVNHVITIGTGTAFDPMQIIPFIPVAGELSMGMTSLFSDTFSPEHKLRLEAAYGIGGTRAALLVYIRRQYTIDGMRLLWGVYEDIEAPTLHVSGTLDQSIPPKAAKRIAQRTGGKFVAIEGASHDVHIDEPDQLAHEILRFIEPVGS